jgi:hypothetical protein
MPGFFRKVAGAFIEIEREQEEPKGSEMESGGSLEAMNRDAAQLLAQLEGKGPGVPPPLAQSQYSSFNSPSPEPTVSEYSTLEMNADQVFTAGGLLDGPNSAQRILKLIAGLSMFPAQQQVLMLRAMDAADDTWSEAEVLEDARRRQSVLRRHLQIMDNERNSRLTAINQRIEETRTEGQKLIQQIDEQLAQLQKERETAVIGVTNAVGDLEQEKKSLEATAENASRGITQVINSLSQLITFFSGTPGNSSSQT